MSTWYSSKEIRNILKISTQYLYLLKKTNKIIWKKISDKKFLFQLPENIEQERNIALYARVSTLKQKIDLQNQIEALKLFALSQGSILNHDYIYSEIASGMNENRNKLNILLNEVKNGNISKIYISHKDRLTRFGFGYLENFCKMYKCEIISINYTEEKTFQEELTEDLIAIIHNFSMKFYGKRKNFINNIKKEVNTINDLDN